MKTQARYPNAKQFRKELESGASPSHLYLFLGEEEGEKDKVIQLVTDSLLRGLEDRRGVVASFHAEDPGEIARAAEFAMSPSLFSSSRVCILRDAEKTPGGKASTDLLRDIVENIAGGTTLIITTGENRPPAIISGDLLEHFRVVQFWRLFEQDIHNYVAHSVKKMGMAIDDEAVDRLLDLTGRDIKKIDEALDMIRFSGETDTVTAGVVKDFVHDVKRVTIFEYLDHFFSGNPGAIEELKKLLNAGTPDLLVLSMIMREAESMERYLHLTSGGAPRDEALKGAGVNPRAADHFLRRLARYDAAALRRLFGEIARADRALKGAGRSKQLLTHPLFELTGYAVGRLPGPSG
ncbi:MAG: DNA polymerase III subunit delta [Spirochaetes bacterium]|nr:DNA polymerase III subunit delta [Spirochaetota bacterium]